MTSVLDPWEVDLSKIEIPLVMGNDLNVEKAEAYTKDLEDVSKLPVSLDFFNFFLLLIELHILFLELTKP